MLHEKVSSLEILKCFVNVALISINSYSSLTAKKAFEVICNNNIGLWSWYSACCGLPLIGNSTPDRGKWSISSPKISDRIFYSPSLPFNGFQGPFYPEQRGKNVKRVTQSHLLPRLRMMKTVPPPSQRNSCTFT